MANSRNDDLDRIGNRNTPQGSNKGNTQGRSGNVQGSDPVNLDRKMNRDGNLGQGSSGTERGRDGSHGATGTKDTATKDTGRRPPDTDSDE